LNHFNEEIIDCFATEGIEMPYPTQTLFLNGQK
jgi:small-conductance mechanosensitive channel